jgi:hypothetical protein
MNNQRINVFIVFITIAICVSTALAGDRITVSIGGGYGGFNTAISTNSYNGPQPDFPSISNVDYASNGGYNYYGEISFPAADNLSLGIGVQYIFGNSSINYQYDPYDSERIIITGLYLLTAEMDFAMPYLAAQYHWSILGNKVISRMNIGYGYGELITQGPGRGALSQDANGFGIIPSLEIPFMINTRLNVNLEFGYRYIRTGHLAGMRSVTTPTCLDFSGFFVQSGVSFNL